MPEPCHDRKLAAGTRVGRYEVQSFLGSGGMGEVYVARDTSLGRQIALKVLPDVGDPQRIARFVREAKASSALNHPAIVSVHDAGESDGVHFLAMELIDGQPLSDWMTRRHDVRRGIALLAEVADALTCAHGAGIVHRDLKPANIMIGSDGYARVVDFGVAKLTEPAFDRDAATDAKTARGSLLGTVAYMSPEQAEGGEVDARSDIFSFGTILYSLLARRHPFAAATTLDTLHDIAHADPPLDVIPERYRRIVRRCLAKEKSERYQSAKDIAHDLRDALAEPDASARKPRKWAWITAVAAGIAISAVLIWLIAQQRERPPSRGISMERITTVGDAWVATMSPDGRFVVWSSAREGIPSLWVMQTATGTITRRVPFANDVVGYPLLQVSPDGNYIFAAALFLKNTVGIYRMPILGGAPQKVVSNLMLHGFSVSPDGARVAFIRADGTSHALMIVDSDGTGERLLLRRQPPLGPPAWAPDGKTIAFVHQRRIEEASVATGATNILSPASWRAIYDMRWLPDGTALLLCAAAGEEPPRIWLVHRGAGAPVAVTSDVSAYYSVTPLPDSSAFAAVRAEGPPSISILSVTSEGAQVETSGLGSHFGFVGARARGFPMVWATVRWLDSEHLVHTGAREGHPTLYVISRTGGEPRELIRDIAATSPAISPDQTRVAFISERSGLKQVWTCGADGRALRQLTRGEPVWGPEFSSDGRFIEYSRERDGQLWRVPSNGGAAEALNMKAFLHDLSPDGRWRVVDLDNQPILTPLAGGATRSFDRARIVDIRFHPFSRSFAYADSPLTGIGNLWLQDIEGGPPRQLTRFGRGVIYSFDWSPDGKSIAVMSGQPTADLVLIRNFR